MMLNMHFLTFCRWSCYFGFLLFLGCNKPKSYNPNNLVLAQIDCQITPRGNAKVHLDKLNGGHAICVKSTPEIKEGDIVAILVNNGSSTKIEIGKKGTFADSIDAKYVAMIYANDSTDLTISFHPSFNNRHIQIIVMKSPKQTM
jgi:hypothetical protein